MVRIRVSDRVRVTVRVRICKVRSIRIKCRRACNALVLHYTVAVNTDPAFWLNRRSPPWVRVLELICMAGWQSKVYHTCRI